MSIYSDPYWKRREEADDERESPAPDVESAEGAQVAAPAVESAASERTDSEGAFAPIDVSTPDPLAGKPEFGPVEPPPPVPPDVAPPPPGPPEASEFGPYQPNTPKVDAAPDMKAQRLKAIAEARRMASAPDEAPDGLRDSDLAAAQANDRKRAQRDDLTMALSDWLMRRPARASTVPSEADALSHRRALSDKTAASGLNRKLDLESRLIAAMKGEKAPGAGQKYDDPYHTALGDQARSLVDERTRKAADEKTRRERETGETDALRREAAKKLPGVDVSGLSVVDLRSLIHAKDAKERTYIMAAAAAKKANDKSTEDVPPGYEIRPDANPGPDSRKKFTALVASQQKMKELTGEMRRELQGAGIADRLLPGEKKRRLQQLATQMRIEAKNVAELGALSGPDMGLIESIATDPTNLQSLAGGSLDANLAGLDKWADSSVSAGERAYGLRKVGGANGGTTPGGHGKVVKETKSFRQYEDDFIEEKT